MPTLTVELPEAIKEPLRQAAEERGQTPQALVAALVTETVARGNGWPGLSPPNADSRVRSPSESDPTDEEARRQAQIARNQAAIEVLEQWREEPVGEAEAHGYPSEITPLQLREISIA